MAAAAVPADLSRFVELSGEALCVLGEQGNVQYVNEAFGRIAGCRVSAAKGRPLVDFVHPDDRPAVKAQVDVVASAASPTTLAFRLGLARSAYQRVECTLHPDGDAGRIFAVLRSTTRDATSEVYRAAMESSPCATAVVDANGLITMVNKETERLFGYSEGELVGQPVEALVPENLRESHTAHRLEFGEAPSARPMGQRRDLMGQRRDGSLVPVEVGLNPIRTQEGAFFVCAIIDLSERKRAEQRIAQQAEMLELANARLLEMASTDSLTSLRNRRAFLDQLNVQLEQAVRNGQPVSVLILDVDHFKPYNDRYGHLAGDEVLKGVARVLQATARRSDYVARIGGEEFGIISPQTDQVGAALLSERFRAAIEGETWPRREITASIGATTVAFSRTVPRPTIPGHSAVLRAADRALYHSKEHGRNRSTHSDDIAEQS
jgi:diguanylate cyclase (GGDEF)-like protein/PAS domain S-box-containing protein